jgi:UDP-hydrolysing UDP-N-acetyl-D-glucosamine 2-epimerase
MPVRKIAAVTVGRSDYGLSRPILRRLDADPAIALQLLVSGAHFDAASGNTFTEIEADGFKITERLPLANPGVRPESVAASMGAAVTAFAQAYAKHQPDLLLVIGDRFEMHAAALAALPMRVPVAHVHGGELTFGAIDDALRHSITKLSHLHFAATEEYAARIRQMGEEPWRITVSGAPGLDNLGDIALAPLADFAARHDLLLTQPPVLVTFHPVTLEHDRTEWHITELLAALAEIDAPLVFTLPNVDTGHQSIIRALREFVAHRANAFLVANLGTRDYFSAMSWSLAMVGNSSSGIIEAASFRLPVVNIGQRQAGRTRAANVIDCEHDRASIAAAVRRAVDSSFRATLAGLKNPYGDGHAAERIVPHLRDVELGPALLTKRFADLPVAK